MKEIKTKEAILTAKVFDRSAIAAQKTKEAIIALKESTDDVKNDTAVEYASDKAGEAVQYAEARLEQRIIKRQYKGIKSKEAVQGTVKSAIRKKIKAQTEKLKQFAAKHMSAKAKRVASKVTHVVKTSWTVMKKLAQAARTFISVLIAGGSAAVFIIVVILLVGLLVASPFGLFLSGEAGENGYSMKQTTAQLTKEYYDEVKRIERRISHDRVEVISSDGLTAINWEDVLAVYAIKTTAGKEGADVATMDDRKLDILRGIMWEMNEIDYHTRIIEFEVPVTIINEDGEEETEIQIFYETILTIDLTHKTSEEAAAQYGFTPAQRSQLAEMQSDEFSNLWINLIGAYIDANGEIIETGASWVPNGFFSWPLPINGDFTSPFGYRHDPFSGEIKFHGGIDLGAAQNTPILASADGTIVVANSTDSWGYGYGYHVKIDHGNGYSTLYGHCNAVAVLPGQNVQKGQVIAYVGTTGNSTGNHLHFEVYQGGARVDPMGFFQ